MNGTGLLDRLTAAMLKLLDRQRLLQTGFVIIEALERNSVEQVRGERHLFGELAQRLDALCQRLRAVPPDTALSELEALVDLADWEVAQILIPDLEARLKVQQSLIDKAGTQLKIWEVQFDQLAKVVNSARFEGAPFGALEEELKAVERRISQLRSSLADRMHGELQEQCEAAEQAIAGLAGHVKQAAAQVSRVKGLARQADLLIMNMGLDEDEYIYRVLLRSPERTQTRGISIIQEIRRLPRLDREDFLLGGFERLSESINLRLRHDTDSNAPSAAAAPTQATPTLPDIGAQLLDLGRFMGQMMISPQMREVLWGHECSFSITTNDLQLPWELICLDPPPAQSGAGERVLCLDKSISRMPLGDRFPDSGKGRRGTGVRRRMLLIHSDPKGNLRAAGKEVDSIAEEFADVLEIVRLNPKDATNARLNQALGGGEAFDFIHYTGHAHFDEKHPARSGLQLMDCVFDADKIRKLSKGGSLVFLNACESGSVANADSIQSASYLMSRPDPVVGLASAFIYSGALGCVGSLWPVYDRAASQLAVKFYRYVLEGDPTGEALRHARADIREAYPAGCTWAGYVLYGDPTFRLTES